MITIYGIKNCDTVQKALKWLSARNIAYVFHNYKDSGIDAATLQLWLAHFPAGKLINTRSTTYRSLTQAEQNAIASPQEAIALMMKYNSVIKRPIIDLGDGRLILGGDEQQLKLLLAVA